MNNFKIEFGLYNGNGQRVLALNTGDFERLSFESVQSKILAKMPSVQVHPATNLNGFSGGVTIKDNDGEILGGLSLLDLLQGNKNSFNQHFVNLQLETLEAQRASYLEFLADMQDNN